MATMQICYVKNAQKNVKHAQDHLMANANHVKLIISYTMEIVSLNVQKDIMEKIEFATHVILTVKLASVELTVNVIHVLKDSSLQAMDTLVLNPVKIMNTETLMTRYVNHVMEHAVLAMDQNQLHVHLVVMVPTYMELNVYSLAQMDIMKKHQR